MFFYYEIGGITVSKKYESLAKDIVKFVGGKENIASAYHCQTRIRFNLKDNDKADTKKLEKLDGVSKVLINAGVYQVVIGTHVAEVFEEVERYVDLSKDNTEVEEKSGFVNGIISFVAATFQPIIPALSGAGMVKAVMALLVVFHLIDSQSQTYTMLNIFADGVFYFLPVMIAFCEAKKLKCNQILAAGVAAMMLHPNWLAMVNVADKVPVNFLGIIPFRLTSYASSVIPIILIVFVQAYVEKLLKRIIPKAVELVFLPMLTFLIMGTLAFSILGPVGSIAGDYLAVFFTFLSTNASWAPAVIVGGLLPVMVMFGIHNGVAPLGVMQMANLGYDSIFGPGCVCSNMAQATAGLIVALRTKKKTEKTAALSGSITAYMGITEPILYGTNLPKKYPLVSAMIGGGFGGLYAGLTHTHRFATGSSGLPAVLLYIGDNTMAYFINIIIAIIISISITGILTFILSLKYEKDDLVQSDTVSDKEFIAIPLKGEVKAVNEAKDEAFSSEALGKGAVIIPSEGKLYSPVDGIVETVFPTKHAIGLKSDGGAEILIHIGVDTVKLEGRYFESHIEAGDRVRKGDLLVSFDKYKIESEGYDTQTMIVVTNSDNYRSVSLLPEDSKYLLALSI